MGDGEKKSVSPRGAFFVGLALGLGVAVLIYVFQTERLKNELNHLRADLSIEHTRWAADHEQICKALACQNAPAAADASTPKKDAPTDPK